MIICIKMDLALNNLQRLICQKKNNQSTNQPTNVIRHQSFVYTYLNGERSLFLTIQFSVRHLLVLGLNIKQFYLTNIQDIGATTTSHSEPGSNGIKGVLYIPKSFWTGVSPSDGLVLYQGCLLWKGSYSSAEIQSVYSTTPVD